MAGILLVSRGFCCCCWEGLGWVVEEVEGLELELELDSVGLELELEGLESDSEWKTRE